MPLLSPLPLLPPHRVFVPPPPPCNTADSEGDTLAGILLRLKYNAYPVRDPFSSEGVGVGLYPSAALFNHSCAPTVSYHSAVTLARDGRLLFRSTRPVAAGETATIAYVDVYQSRQHVAAVLRDGYNFECRCVRGVRAVEGAIEGVHSGGLRLQL